MFVTAPPLSVDRVTDALGELADLWDDIAVWLGVSTTTRESITKDHRTNIHRLEAIVRWYLYRCPLASWRHVITQLDEMCDVDHHYREDLNRVLSRISSFAEEAGQSKILNVLVVQAPCSY